MLINAVSREQTQSDVEDASIMRGVTGIILLNKPFDSSTTLHVTDVLMSFPQIVVE